MTARILLLLTLLSAGLSAKLVGIDVSERSPVLDGKAFGNVGAYERVIGKAHFAVDPDDPANAIIHDLEFVPRNAQGRVEFSADIYLLRPVDPGKGSGTVLFEVSNRGGKGLLAFNRARGSRDPRTAEQFGDGLLMERGYTLLWVGWQFDLVDSPNALRLFAPSAQGIDGWVRSLVTPLAPTKTFSVAGAGHVPYEATNVNDPDARLITRLHMDSPGRDTPRDKWRFIDSSTVEVDGGLTPGRSYEVIYRSKDPGVAGLGPAAIRDFVSFLKFGVGGSGLLAELPQGLERSIGYGSSQSGRFLRQYLYDGFNADEQGRIVFDGAWPHISGAARGSFTHRFAQATRQDPYYTVAVFPFRDLTDTDPVTGQSAGLLAKYQNTNAMPKVFYTVTSSEYFARSASLVTTSIDGAAEAPLADTTRFYYMTGTQHGAGSVPPSVPRNLQNRANSNDYWPLMRALLVNFDDWVTKGKEPPPSRYPSVGELASLEDLNFPKIPNFTPLGYQRKAMRLDFGPEFLSKGVISNQPPEVVGPKYPAKVPQLDRDGNEVAGVRLPSVQVPLATYFGWNLPKPEVADVDENLTNTGSTLPFPFNKAQRLANHDPRLSVEERYGSRDAYGARVNAAAALLVAERHLLPRDVDAVVNQCLAMWDFVAAQ
ncbi:MAG: alpha/beta hydrolase domain-containing protein [Acidobacteria bacterium]|nr:alpha/beta hydrolase domain-containing protein [Acidobacteriota bacterium]MDA1235164.1 alpha/beta hydrolase domain-containing protein [Acidobacteriota bacterium]